VLAQQDQVPGQRDAGLGDVGGGLVQGQRQEPQLRGDLPRRLRVTGADAPRRGGDQGGGGVADVVEDEQPPGMGLQPGERPPGRLRRRRRQGKVGADTPGQSREAGLDLAVVFCGDPPGQRVAVAVGVRVLQGELGFADAAEPEHRLRHHHASAA
jgi:hypothetical protein